jgi:hypothetical protein
VYIGGFGVQVSKSLDVVKERHALDKRVELMKGLFVKGIMDNSAQDEAFNQNQAMHRS